MSGLALPSRGPHPPLSTFRLSLFRGLGQSLSALQQLDFRVTPVGGVRPLADLRATGAIRSPVDRAKPAALLRCEAAVSPLSCRAGLVIGDARLGRDQWKVV